MSGLKNTFKKFHVKVRKKIPSIESFENFRSGSNLSLFILFWIGLISSFMVFNIIRYYFFNGDHLSIYEPLTFTIFLIFMFAISRTRYYKYNIYLLILFLSVYVNLQFYFERDQISYFFLYTGINLVIQMTASLFLTLKKSFFIPLAINTLSTFHLLIKGYSIYGSLGFFQALLFLDLVFFVINYYYQKRYEQVQNYLKLLEKEKNFSEQALNVKNKFLSKMSHELRTPLNIASGALQTACVENYSSADQKKAIKKYHLEEKYFNMIKKANYDLTGLINNLIIYSEINENLLVNYDYFNLESVIKECISFYSPFITKEIKFYYQLKQFDSNILIKSDKYLLRHILDNLISNSIKNTSSGFIEINVEIKKQNDSKALILVSVKDSGVGISPVDQENIFKGFDLIQNDNFISKSERSSGLGLSITKKILDVLRGQISFESEMNRGTSFYISFESNFINSSEITYPKIHKRLLIAEDDLENQELLKIQLKKSDYKFDIFENGKQLVDYYTSSTENYLNYDIILMDLRMPVMDGFEATKAIRDFQTEHKIKKIPIIAVTAHALKNELLKSLDAGCNSYITKPYDFKDLQILIRKYTDRD